MCSWGQLGSFKNCGAPGTQYRRETSRCKNDRGVPSASKVSSQSAREGLAYGAISRTGPIGSLITIPKVPSLAMGGTSPVHAAVTLAATSLIMLRV